MALFELNSRQKYNATSYLHIYVLRMYQSLFESNVSLTELKSDLEEGLDWISAKMQHLQGAVDKWHEKKL